MFHHAVELQRWKWVYCALVRVERPKQRRKDHYLRTRALTKHVTSVVKKIVDCILRKQDLTPRAVNTAGNTMTPSRACLLLSSSLLALDVDQTVTCFSPADHVQGATAGLEIQQRSWVLAERPTPITLIS